MCFQCNVFLDRPVLIYLEMMRFVLPPFPPHVDICSFTFWYRILFDFQCCFPIGSLPSCVICQYFSSVLLGSADSTMHGVQKRKWLSRLRLFNLSTTVMHVLLWVQLLFCLLYVFKRNWDSVFIPLSTLAIPCFDDICLMTSAIVFAH